jgi:hypothetical protein
MKKTIYSIQSILTIVMQGQIIPQPQSTSPSIKIGKSTNFELKKWS